MDEPRDDIDSWLSERVTPLLPHPGAFERVRKRARRRKLGQVATAAGGAAVIVAAAFTVPHLVISRLHPTSSTGPYVPSSVTPSSHPSSTPSPTPSPSATPTATASAAPPGPAPVPANFQPSSVTFVSTLTGWVIGQAGTPGQCANADPYICTSVAITSDGGNTWRGSPAPDAGAPNGARGVSGIRSLDGVNGWAFGPQLYSTHNGGQTWTKIATHGMRVTDLETVNGHTFAMWARCTGTGADFAANCTSFSLYSTPAGVDQWAPVPGAANLTSGQPNDSSAQLVLTGTTGYLLSPSGTVYSGQVSGGNWGPVSTSGSKVLPCYPGPAQADGVPSGAMLATTGTGLAEVCTGNASGGTQTKTLLYSADGGHTWQTAGTAPLAGIVTSLSGTPGGPVVLATTGGIDVSTRAPQAGRDVMRWRTTQGAAVAAGFSYVGMTTNSQGVAIPADGGLHAVWFTYDGGVQWGQSAVH
jgi:hypothetical protein